MYYSQTRLITWLVLFTCLSGGNLCFAKQESFPSAEEISDVNVSQDDGALNSFLLPMLGEHPNWLKENNLDPSTPFSQPTNLSFSNDEIQVQLDCQISNYYVSGLSERMGIRFVSSSLIYGYLKLGYFSSSNITFGGEYSATGSIMNSSLSASGDWRIVAQSHFMSQDIQYNFEITADGYLNITGLDPERTSTRITQVHEIEFEGLLDDDAHGLEEQIEFLILKEFNEFLSNATESGQYPGRGEMYEYFQKLFSDTPLSEIIGTTFLPTQSTPLDTSTGLGSAVKIFIPLPFIASICLVTVILLN